MYIVSLTYIEPLEKINAFIPEHIEFLNRQYDQGHFQLSGRKEPRTGGVILVTVKSLDLLNAILEQDPFHREKLARYDITEMIPSKSSDALAFLVEA